MNDLLFQLIAFTHTSTRSWASTARTITLITALLWLPTLILAFILTRSIAPLLLLSATNWGAGLVIAGLITKRKRYPRSDAG